MPRPVTDKVPEAQLLWLCYLALSKKVNFTTPGVDGAPPPFNQPFKSYDLLAQMDRQGIRKINEH